MSKPRNRNSLLSAHNRSTYVNSTKDELLQMKFQMKKPDLPLYPLNDIEMTETKPSHNGSSGIGTNSNVNSNSTLGANNSQNLTYPDYNPWKDHNELPEGKRQKEYQRLNNPAFLNKGYFETPIVSNEYYSARNLIQATIFSSTENCNNVLKELSSHLANGYKTRNEIINKIRFSSNNFKLPPRVTLTASKRESWLKDLANPSIPISKISEKIPHGIRNKVLIDLICNKNVPINRALWFTKCVLYGELIALRRKHQSRPISPESLEKFEIHWLQEWTQQVSDYIYKYSKELSSVSTQERKHQYMNKLHYLLNYTQALYIECILEKSFFLSLVLRSLKDDLPLQPAQLSQLLTSREEEVDSNLASLEINYGQRLVSLTLIKIFWKDILKLDYLSKELSETLLLNYFFISKVAQNQDKLSSNAVLPESLKLDILKLISDQIIYLFKYNTNAFIIPNYWMVVSKSLFKILREDSEGSDADLDVEKQLDLIKYRNESLMLNMRGKIAPITPGSNNTSSGPTPSNGDAPTEEIMYINRNSDDLLRVVQHLDKLMLNNELANSLKPSHQSSKTATSWRTILRLVIYWCISVYRNNSSERILIICNFIKRKVLQSPNSKSNHLKLEFENEILEIIYSIAERNDSRIQKYNLHVLINELYQLKVITISTYLRKLIASGIFYQSPGSASDSSFSYDPSVEMHLDILQNLPVLNNKQCDSILKRWTPNGFDFNEKFDKGKATLQEQLIDGIISDNASSFEITYVNELNVGLKFLLINWVTNELKSTISTSPKLVHINPLKISHLYRFYASSDNLAVFFKVLVKFLLKNEGGMIILYLDSLYLISRLVMKHFKLIKFIAGSSYESASTAYELFQLIIVNYKDLQSREFDYFNFGQVWKFIDVAIGKTYDSKVESKKNWDTFETPKNTHDFKSVTPMKSDYKDTPMKMDFKETPKNAIEYKEESLRSDLDYLLGLGVAHMEQSEVHDIIEGLSLSIDLTNPTAIRQSIAVQLQFLVSGDKLDNNELEIESETESSVLVNSSIPTEEQQSLVAKLLVHTRNLLSEEPDVFGFELNNFNQASSNSLKKIALFEIGGLLELLEPLNDSAKIYDCLFDDRNLTDNQLLLLDLIRDQYKTKSPNFSSLILSGIRDSDPILKDNPLVWDYLRGLVVVNPQLIMDEIVSKCSVESSIILFNNLLNNKVAVSHISDLDQVHINEFNLPMYQILLRVILHRDLMSLDGAQSRQHLKEMVHSILGNLAAETASSFNSYFGELFNLVTWEYRLMILDILEEMFLEGTEFSIGEIKLVQHSDVNLLPVLNDFFKKFSASTMSSVSSNAGFFSNLSKFLNGLVDAANTETENINHAISIFLRILIIHKPTLCSKIIASVDYSFIQNLIALLNSTYLSQKNEKLRILLYDLLLLLKAAITEESITSETDLEATSPGYMPTPSAAKNSPETKQEALTPAGTAESSGGALTSSHISAIFNLPESYQENPLREKVDENSIGCCIMLDEEELQQGGDYHSVNESNLELISNGDASLTNTFGILVKERTQEFKMRSFEILEDVSGGLNDGCINLHLFDAYTTKENPL